ncbi:MAG: glycosyltransferase family 39 protein [Anaerolineales bacterium]|nr:glycosyltransferase family 39 protein [Anaerolineales bacterium]
MSVPSYRLAKILLVFLVIEALLMGWARGVRLIFPDLGAPGGDPGYYVGVELETRPWLEPWQRWDTPQYQAIAERGYTAFDTALFTPPLYPLLMHLAAAVLTGGNTLAAGLLVSGLAFLGCLIAAYNLARFEFQNDPAALRSVLYLACFPTAFFLAAAYSESLFLLLAILCLHALRRQKWALAGLWGGLAALTRITGLFLVVPLAYALWAAWQEAGEASLVERRQIAGRGLAAGALMMGLYAIFPAWIWLGLGRPPTAILDALNARGGTLTLPGLNILEAVRRIFLGQLVAENLIELTFSLVFIVLTVFIWTKLPRIYGLYAAVLILFFLTRMGSPQPLVAMTRYVLEIFPAFLLLGLWGQKAWVNRLVLYLSWPGLLFFTAQFVIWGWVG